MQNKVWKIVPIQTIQSKIGILLVIDYSSSANQTHSKNKTDISPWKQVLQGS